MVNLLSGSGVDQSKYPHSYRWDSSVRQHYEKYQRLIDAHTYRLQRIQRGILVCLLIFSHFHILSTIIPNYSLLSCCRESKKLAKSIKPKLISIKTLINVLLLTSTEHLIPT